MTLEVGDETKVDLGAFDENDQLRFAVASGDFNPLHLDTLFARKTFLGKPVVHGMHQILRLFDLTRIDGRNLAKINASFLSPARVGEELYVVLKRESELGFTAKIFRSSTRKLLMRCRWAWGNHRGSLQEQAFPQAEPSCPELIEKGDTGSVSLNSSAPAEAKIANDIAVVMASSTIVGMKIPGLNSVLASLNLSESNDSEANVKDAVEYEVLNFDDRFGMVTLGVKGGGYSGDITAFKRPVGSDLTEAEIPKVCSFSDRRILIVGGTRGMGATTARILAKSRSDVLITYLRGKAEAADLLSKFGDGDHTAQKLDVANLDENSLDKISEWSPDAVFFFATPFIFEGDGNTFNTNLFDKFSSCYASNFFKLIEGLMLRGAPLRQIWYPSSEAVEDFPIDMVEYAAAKAAGEVVCKYISKRFPKLEVLMRRFPRVETDQTRTVTPVPSRSQSEVILEWLEYNPFTESEA